MGDKEQLIHITDQLLWDKKKKRFPFQPFNMKE